MTNKTVIKTPRAKKDVPAKQDKQSDNEHYAKISLSASFMSAAISDSFTSALLPDAKLADVASALGDKVTTIQNGDMKPIEAMLIGQAQALQTMFVTLGRKAVAQTQLPHYTAFMNMALKAQSQSRATIQALTELKYPKQATFVKQVNITTGNQQVNNGLPDPSHVKEKTIQSNELLENQKDEWLDSGAKGTASGINQDMAAVET